LRQDKPSFGGRLLDHLQELEKAKEKKEQTGIAYGLSKGSKKENKEIGCIWAALEVV